MSWRRWLKIGCLTGLTCLGGFGCAARDCTDEERAEADAEDDQTCKALVPFAEFTDSDEEIKTQAWSPGDDLLIDGDIREIDIIEGSGDEISVSYRAQVDLAQDRPRDVVRATWDDLTNHLTKGDSVIAVSADRGDSDANLGAKVVVELPPDFDGDIEIDIKRDRPGRIDLEFVGAAQRLEVDKDSLGELRLKTALLLNVVEINTKGDILTGTFDSPDLEQVVLHNELGDIQTSFSEPPSHSARIMADFGDVDIELPDTGDYTMQVQAEDGVSISGVPGACEVDDEEETAQSMTCNAGDPDRVTFQIQADRAASIGFR